ncbi:MAG: DNA (cytosine-5-)-methyltransferase [Chitinophagaceae bacterium]
MKTLTHGGLFEGIGGFSLGAHRVGIESLFAVEISKYKMNILKQHFPKIKLYGDITTIQHLPYVDILTGGFPCQDISVSGSQTGLQGNRSGLWSEFQRIIKIVCPRYVIIENSSNLLNKGLEYILYDLAALGYDAEWKVLSARQFGARHIRKRLFIIAYTPNTAQVRCPKRTFKLFKKLQEVFLERKVPGQTDVSMLLERIKRYGNGSRLRRNDEFSKGLDKDRLEAIGDSVYPKIAEYLMRCIKMHYEKN